MQCISLSQTTNRAQISFAEDIKQTEKGPAARNVLNIVFTDPKEAAVFTPGDTYAIEISK